MASDVLFTPFSFKGLTLPNRVVMAPMTRSMSPDGVATEEVAAYYRRRAEGQVGLIVSEGTGVDRPASLNDPNIPRFHGEAELAVIPVSSILAAAPDVVLAGRFPSELQSYIDFAIGISAAARDAKAARVLSAFLTSAASDEGLAARGLERH